MSNTPPKLMSDLMLERALNRSLAKEDNSVEYKNDSSRSEFEIISKILDDILHQLEQIALPPKGSFNDLPEELRTKINEILNTDDLKEIADASDFNSPNSVRNIFSGNTKVSVSVILNTYKQQLKKMQDRLNILHELNSYIERKIEK